tara:strand:- start:554 stop:1111 length:558 start_codon:yes stop_codon:yes gene_type:complete
MTDVAGSGPAMVDIVILAVMAISLVFGLFRGLLRELLSLVSWVLAFWIAYRYSANVAEIIDRALQNPTLSQAVSAVLVFVIVLVALMVLTSLIAKLFKATGLAGIDRILGGLFGLGRGVVILLAALILASHTGAVEQDWYNASTMIPMFDRALDWMAAYVPAGTLEGFGAGLLEGELPGNSGSAD